ncbi:MAG: hypothetical protein HY927_06065 [Elusimicrobia bacterium]|nr:hypothetical protein [Elusimicrobiota bacterium]
MKQARLLLGTLAVAAAFVVAAGRPAPACDGCAGHKADHKKEACCPMKVDGAQAKVVNTADGVTITITSKDPETVKKIQESAAKAAAGGLKSCPKHGNGAEKAGAKAGKAEAKKAVYACPMKDCYRGEKTKDGRCPKCGMKLEEAK